MDVQIRQDDLSDGRIERLLLAHRTEMLGISPPDSVHALDRDALRAPGLTFWGAWDGDEFLGCGALKDLGDGEGEIKAMRTAETARRRGVGSRILERILDEASRRGYAHVHLETGAQPEFEPARALYERYGFMHRGPFGDYADDPNSVFMTRPL